MKGFSRFNLGGYTAALMFAIIKTEMAWSSPFMGAQLYSQRYWAAAEHARALRESGQVADAHLIDELSSTPIAIWLGEWSESDGNSVGDCVSSVITAAGDLLPLFVVYMIPHRDRGQYSAGGAGSDDDYLCFIRSVADAASASGAPFILEPDALAHAAMMDDANRTARLRLLQRAHDILVATGCTVYVDVGHARWLPAATAACLLRSIGADHFALNVSNFVGEEETLAYGNAVAFALGPAASFVIDVGRCGTGPAIDGAWCNPSGRALGPPPSPVANGRCDARLWVKVPGESDGDAARGAPAAGQYWPEGALELVRNRVHTPCIPHDERTPHGAPCAQQGL